MSGWTMIAQLINPNWLNSTWSESKYYQYLAARTLLPGYAQYTDALYGARDTKNYLKNNDMDWGDVTNPNRLPGTNAIVSAGSWTLNYVSRNISRLYK